MDLSFGTSIAEGDLSSSGEGVEGTGFNFMKGAEFLSVESLF